MAGLTWSGLQLLRRLSVYGRRLLLLLTWRRQFLALNFALTILSAVLLHPGAEVATLVCRELATPNRFTRGSCHVGSLIALLTDDHIKFHDLSIAHRANSLFRVVARNSALVHEDILFGVVPVDEAIAALYIEPLDGAGDFGGDDFLWRRSWLALLSLQLLALIVLLLLIQILRRLLLLFSGKGLLLLLGSQRLVLSVGHREAGSERLLGCFWRRLLLLLVVRVPQLF